MGGIIILLLCLIAFDIGHCSTQLGSKIDEANKLLNEIRDKIK